METPTMKTNKLFVLLFVLVLAAFAVTPVFAQGANPPVAGPAFDWTLISNLLQSLVLATVPVVAGYGVKLLVVKAENERARLSSEQQWALDLFIKTAVYAAEQMKLSGYVDDKLDYVTKRVESWLADRRIILDGEEIRARIEASVKQEINSPAKLQ